MIGADWTDHFLTPARLRFSPSPKAYCHLGLARTALLLDLLRRRGGGQLVIRLDDLVGATEAPFEADGPLLSGLRAIGVEWDHDPWNVGGFGPLAQRSRAPVYKEALERLLERGAAYRCACAPKERAEDPWKCDCLGRPPAPSADCVVRFKLDHERPARIMDLVRGELLVRNARISDPILIRSDQRATYYLAYPADDAALGITLPLFERSIQSTAIHGQICGALGHDVPMTVHIGKLLPPPPEAAKPMIADDNVFDLETYLKVGVPPGDIVLMLLHSLFGTWRGPYPDDLDEAAFAAPWNRLKYVDMQLPIGLLTAARRSRARTRLAGTGAS